MLAGVLCGASVFKPGTVARYAPDLAGHRQRHPDSFYRGNCNGVLKVKKFAACSFMATVLVVSTLLSPFSAVSTASAEDAVPLASTLTPGIHKPTSIGIGTDVTTA